MKNEELLISRELRDKCAGRYEVLEKVKALLLIPGTELMTVKQVAEYYEVDKKVIEMICIRHKDELLNDGITTCSYKDFLNQQSVGLEKMKGKVIFSFSDGEVLEVPNRGLKVFPRRAVLRVGMLLRDSEVAKEIRTQLLNIEEKTSSETKVKDINEEQKLMLEVGMAYASGDTTAVMIATTKMMDFKNRHIQKLEQDNRGLAGEILEWKDRSKLNAGVRKLAAVTKIRFSEIWNELYKNLQYKYSINLKARGNGNKPYIQHIKENEWDKVIKSFCAMCEAYGQSPSEMFQQKLKV